MTFTDDDPFAPPPENLTYIGSLRTGRAYRDTYKELITKPNQILLPVPMYIDGAITAQFNQLPIEALKFTLGIFTKEARDQDWAWRSIGLISDSAAATTRGKNLYKESQHMDSSDLFAADEGDSSDEGADSEWRVQDYHTQLATILEEFVELQETGFLWDLKYKGKVYKDVEFVVFVPFIKCDTDEADKLCGKYQSRGKNVKHHCRYCHCPNDKTDDPAANYDLKTQTAIQKLIDKSDEEKLKAISQKNIQNAMYDLRFNLGNDRGIHGATPYEILHAILLGIFMYDRDTFVKMVGESAKVLEDINALARTYGTLLTRQSERDLPRTNFSKGFFKTKIQAKEYRGIILLLAIVCRSSAGQKMLATKQKFGETWIIDDWLMLLELHLQWEAYLNEPVMQLKHVKRLARKHRVIMKIMKEVAQRSQGLGLKVFKFHGIIHIISDILLYGVPTEVDTGSNEAHHKGTKAAAKLTQKRADTFNFQTMTRLIEAMIIDFAMAEVEDGHRLWEYLHEYETDSETEEPTNLDAEASDPEDDTATLGHTYGARIEVFRDDDGEEQFHIDSKMKKQAETRWDNGIITFLLGLQDLVLDYLPEKNLPIHTEHKRGGAIFRGHPNFQGSGPWQDWVFLNWGPGYGCLPGQIWCFVVLDLPANAPRLEYGGIRLEAGTYAVVESSTYSTDEDEIKLCDMFIPLFKDVEGINADDQVTKRTFYLADVEAFEGPCCVVADIGGAPNAYFQVKPRSQWVDDFIVWLEQTHKLDQAGLGELDDDETGE